MNMRCRVELDKAERAQLTAMLGGGKHAARKLKRAQILLAADAGVGDEEIARVLLVGGSTVYRTKRRFVEDNLQAALSEEPRPGAARKLSGKETAAGRGRLLQPACGTQALNARSAGGRDGPAASVRDVVDQCQAKLPRFDLLTAE